MTKSFTRVDFDKALESVSPKVRQAYELSHEALRVMGIPHVVIGGLAVNAHGHHYTTKDVDYLVDEKDAFDGTGLVVTHKRGVPFTVDGVDIDFVMERPEYPEGVRLEMRKSIETARKRNDKVVIVADWLLVWMKLNARRSKDMAAVEGLIQAGLDVESVREALSAVGPELVQQMFERCVGNAE